MTAPVKMGVGGAGSLGFHHIRILRDVPGAQLIGFVEEREDRAAQVSAELGVKAFPTVQSLLDEVDALTIVVPTSLHFVVAREALERGKHVFIEIRKRRLRL